MVDEESLTGLLLSELYQLQQSTPIVYDDGCSKETEVPFQLLCGESLRYICLYGDEDFFIVLTNYRFFATCDSGFCSIPVGLIECVEQHHSDIVLLCKDGSSLRLPVDTTDQCRVWCQRIMEATKPLPNFRDAFAFIHYAYCVDTQKHVSKKSKGNVAMTTEALTSEYFRVGLNISRTWRIAECNTKYSLCASYPKLLIVPQTITDSELQQVAKFRSLGRIPAIVWRHRDNGCVIARSSQPMVGVLGWRCPEDEKFLQALSDACLNHGNQAPPMEVMSHGEEPVTSNGHAPSLLILDLRSYTAALGNRAKGGGCEHPDYYCNCQISYKGLPNIHSVRSSFNALRNLMSNAEQQRFLSQLEGTQWLQYISQLLQTALEVVTEINNNARPVLVHCSDGWDRTAQVVALAELLLDPYYRTVKGFRILIEREWLSFGHKFSDRGGFGPDGEQSPVFLQWLDCVHQLLKQFPSSFQFNTAYLIKLAKHCYSQLYGTFLGNCEQERERERVREQTLSIWDQTDKDMINVLYKDHKDVLYPSTQVRSLRLWQELYMTSPLISYTFSAPSLQSLPLATPPNENLGEEVPHSNGGLLCAQGEEEEELTNIELHSHSDTDDEKTLDASQLLWQSGLVADNTKIPDSVEDSFRVVSETNEPSLTTLAVRLSVTGSPNLATSSLSCSFSHHRRGQWPSSSSPLDYSLFSECESRLRLMDSDGLGKRIDPVQARWAELEGSLRQRIRQLEEQVERLSSQNCQTDNDTLGGVVNGKEELCLVTYEEKNDEPSSPLNSDWTCVDVADSNGIKWIPDHAVTHCRLCGAEFWMGRRKHHCRSCGGVFCWKCSNYSSPVPHEQLFKDQRVCKGCFDKLGGHLRQSNCSSNEPT